MIIIGIDPGIAKVGYGVISKTKNLKSGAQHRVRCLDYGVIETDSFLNPGERLKLINNGITKLIKKYKANVLVVENVYFFKNLKTAIPVSQAKGVILLAAAKKKVPVYEFTPLQIKMIITGYGRAEKKQIQKMIKVLLKLKEIPKPDDAADALAAAVCCAYNFKG